MNPLTSKNRPGVQRAVIRFILDRLGNILFSYPTDTWEFATSLLSMGWGFWLIWPTIPVFESAPELYEPFAQVMPEWAWGLTMFLTGAFGFVALFFPRWDRFRLWAAGASAFMWVTLTYAFSLVDYSLTSTPVYGTSALLSSLTVLRLYMARELHKSQGDGFGY